MKIKILIILMKFKVGDKYIEKWIPSVEEIKQFSELSRDFNPIHLHKEMSLRSGYKDVIVHGNLSCAQISRIVGMSFPGKGSIILEQNISFNNPIYPGNIVTFICKIETLNRYINIMTINVKAIKKGFDKNTITVLKGNLLCRAP